MRTSHSCRFPMLLMPALAGGRIVKFIPALSKNYQGVAVGVVF